MLLIEDEIFKNILKFHFKIFSYLGRKREGAKLSAYSTPQVTVYLPN